MWLYHSQYYLLGQEHILPSPSKYIWLDPVSIYSAERSIDGVFCYYVIHFLVEWLYRDLRYHLEPEAYANLGSVERGKKAVVESPSSSHAVLVFIKGDSGHDNQVDLILWNFYAVRLRL